ncbi:GNAT family N-acetyltransferase [Mesorhizobium sp. B2-4-15]|nr:GNAT family N-acetyltransferase [Mesorhizobium sp. B2-4-15]
MQAFAFMDGVIDPPSSAHLLTVDTLRDKARRETGFVALNDGRIVGCVFALERGDDFHVGKLAVAPDCQGQGIGRQLMRAVERLALDRGKAALELQTRIELITNHAAFARLGFHETERTAHEGYARPTSITMRKAIS